MRMLPEFCCKNVTGFAAKDAASFTAIFCTEVCREACNIYCGNACDNFEMKNRIMIQETNKNGSPKLCCYTVTGFSVK